MNLKSIVFALIPAVFILLLLGCGGTPLTPEKALMKRAEAHAEETSDNNWLETYKYLSPRAREVCSNGEWAASYGMGMVMLRGFMGIPEDAKVTLSVNRVTVDGDVGRAFGELRSDGDVIDMGEANEGKMSNTPQSSPTTTNASKNTSVRVFGPKTTPVHPFS